MRKSTPTLTAQTPISSPISPSPAFWLLHRRLWLNPNDALLGGISILRAMLWIHRAREVHISAYLEAYIDT